MTQAKTLENEAADASRESLVSQHLHQVDLAKRWHLSPRTLERWRWLHQGPAYLKIGGRIAYRLEDVVAFELARRRDGGTGVVGLS